MRQTREDQGLTIISPIPQDPEGFYKRMLVAGLRLSLGDFKIGIQNLLDGPTIFATGPQCTGYIFATDGIEASESDLYRFLKAELKEGQAVNVFGRYAPEPEKLVESRAHYRLIGGRVMCVEKRTLTMPDGSVETLRSRADLEYANIAPLREADPDPGFPV